MEEVWTTFSVVFYYLMLLGFELAEICRIVTKTLDLDLNVPLSAVLDLAQEFVHGYSEVAHEVLLPVISLLLRFELLYFALIHYFHYNLKCLL